MKTLWGDFPITGEQAFQLATKANYRVSADGSIAVIPDTPEEAAKIRNTLNLQTKKYRSSRTTILKHLIEIKTFELIIERLHDLNEAIDCYVKQISVYAIMRKQAIEYFTYNSQSSIDDL